MESDAFTLAVVGDVNAPDSLFVSAAGRELGFGSELWRPIGLATLALCNFEGPVPLPGNTRKGGKYQLANSSRLVDSLDQRFVLNLANNHIMDHGVEGLRQTMGLLRDHGIAFGGAGMDLAEASQPVIVARKGKRIGVVCAADPRFHAASPSSPGTFPAKPDLLETVIRRFRPKVGCLVVSVHAGMEFVRTPTPYMLDLSRRCIDSGANIVVYHHAHCLSGWTRYNDGLVLWGIGNYCFPYALPKGYKPWYESAVWQLEIDSESRLSDPEVIPLTLAEDGTPYVCRGREAEHIRRLVNRCGSRIESNGSLWFWRLRSIAHPVYLWLALNNYVEMARQRGVMGVLKFVGTTLGLYFKKDATPAS